MCQCCWKCKFVILKFVVWKFVSRIIVSQCEMGSLTFTFCPLGNMTLVKLKTENIDVFAISWSIFLKQETKGK